jgi:hypothetical protein
MMKLQLFNRAAHKVRYWLLRKLPTCKSMAVVMSESLDRRLNLRERVLLKLHLWVCIWCVWYLEHLQVMSETLRSRPTEALDDKPSPATATTSLSAEARQRLRHALAHKDK